MKKYLLILIPLLLITILLSKPKKDTSVLPDIITIPPTIMFSTRKVYLPNIQNDHIVEKVRFGIGYGLDWRDSLYTQLDNEKLNASWFHSWGIWVEKADMINGLEFVQHLYCDGKSGFDRLKDLSDKLKGRSTYVLFLNEPDMHDQCNISPQRAVDGLILAREKCPTCIFVGAQVSHLDYFNGYSWLRGFMTELRNRGVQPPEVGAFHIYASSPQQAQDITDSYFQVLSDYNFQGKIWITELGGENPETVTRLANICTKNSRIERCAYFSPKCDPNFSWWWFNEKYCLMNLDSTLNTRGIVWSNLTK